MSGRVWMLPCLLGAGEPADVLPQATLQAARSTRHFLAENAKSARAFLKAIGHPRPIADLHIVEIGHEPDDASADTWLAPTRDGSDVAIVCEAGCPGVADPGAGIVARAHALGLRVVPLVGPSAHLLLLMAAGLNGQRFRFLGYLPQDNPGRIRAIRALETESRVGETQLFIETPYRNERLLISLLEQLQPDTRLALGVDLTTQAEDVRSAPVSRWRALAPNNLPFLAKRPTVFAVLATHQARRGR